MENQKKNTSNSNIIGFVLLTIVFCVYTFLNQPTKEQLQEIAQQQQMIQDSLNRVDSLKKVEELQLVQASIDSIQQDTTLSQQERDSMLNTLSVQASGPNNGAFNKASKGEAKTLVLENDKVKVHFSTKGARIVGVDIKGFTQYDHSTADVNDKKDLSILNHQDNKFSYYLPVSNADKGSVATADLYFEPTLDEAKNEIVFKAYSDARQAYIEQRYSLKEGYALDYSLDLHGVNKFLTRNQDIILEWNTFLNKVEKSADYEQRTSTVYFKEVEDDASYCNCIADDQQEVEEKVQWVSHAQQFFNATLITKEGSSFKTANLETKVVKSTEEDYLKELNSTIVLDTKDKDHASYEMMMYIGPSDYEDLAALDVDLEQIIPFGWSIFGAVGEYVIRPLFNFLAMFTSNYGIVILILTLLIQLLLFPLQFKMLKSTTKMSLLRPELDALKEKHKDDAQAMQMEQMKLYQQYGVSPLGGCLPMMLTMPIWIALYRFFPASIEFRQKSFLWADDLASYDSILDFGYIPGIYQIYGDHISLFTLLWVISMFAYLYYNSKNMDMNMAAGNPNAKMMKYMQYAFPVVFFFALNSWAAGLTAYMLFRNLANIAQTLIAKNVLIDKDKLRAEMEEQKKAPAKGGIFDQLLEQQRQQQAAPKNK